MTFTLIFCPYSASNLHDLCIVAQKKCLRLRMYYKQYGLMEFLILDFESHSNTYKAIQYGLDTAYTCSQF